MNRPMNRPSFILPLVAALIVGTSFFLSSPAHAQTEDDLFKQASAALKAERWEEMEQLETQLIAIDSRWFPYFADRGLARLRMDHYIESISDINRAEALFLLTKGTARDHAILVTNRCICFIMRGDPIRALIESTMACQIDETHGNAWKARAEAFYALGDYDGAMFYLGEAQKRDKSIVRTFSRSEAAGNARRHTSIDTKADTTADKAAGSKALEEKRYADAVAIYTRVIEKNPVSLGAWFNRGEAYYNLKDYDRAVEDWTTCFCTLHTTEASAESIAAILVNRANAYRLSRHPRLDEAELDCELALKFQPGDSGAKSTREKIKEARVQSDPEALYERAKNVLVVGGMTILNQDQVLKDLDRVISLDPDNADAWYWRGIAEDEDAFGGRIGSKESALPFFDKAIELEPDNPYSYYHRALIRLHLVRATASERARDRALAESDLSKALELAAKDGDFVPYAEAFFERGKLRRGKPEAIADFTAAIKKNSGDTEYLQYRAEAYEMQKDWRAAIADYTALVKKQPDVYSYSRRGDAYVELKDYDKAVADYSRAIQLAPQNVNFLLGRARALRLAGKKVLALADYRKAWTLDKTVPKIAADLSNAATVDKSRSKSAFLNMKTTEN